MKVIKKRKEWIGIMVALHGMGTLSGVKFAYAVSKNKRKLLEETSGWEEAGKPSEGFLQYEKERIAVCEEFADRDEAGKIKFAKSDEGVEKYLIVPEKKEEFDATLEKLREKHSGDLAAQGRKTEELEAFLEEEVEFDLHSVKEEHLPENITVEQMETVTCFLE